MGKIKNILLWILSIFLLLGAIVYFPSVSSILFVIGALLSFPINPLRKYIDSIGIRGRTKGIIIAILFIVGAIIAPTQIKERNQTSITTAIPSEAILTETPTLEATPTSTPEAIPDPTPENTPQPTEEAIETEPQEQMVWISNSGSRYHRRSTCSGMDDPWQVTISEAQSMGLTACGRCW